MQSSTVRSTWWPGTPRRAAWSVVGGDYGSANVHPRYRHSPSMPTAGDRRARRCSSEVEIGSPIRPALVGVRRSIWLQRFCQGVMLAGWTASRIKGEMNGPRRRYDHCRPRRRAIISGTSLSCSPGRVFLQHWLKRTEVGYSHISQRLLEAGKGDYGSSSMSYQRCAKQGS